MYVIRDMDKRKVAQMLTIHGVVRNTSHNVGEGGFALGNPSTSGKGDTKDDQIQDRFSIRPRRRFCDGISRRNFLSVGAMGSLPQTLAAQSCTKVASCNGKSHAVILLWLGGGCSHHDLFDVKPEAHGDLLNVKLDVRSLRVLEEPESVLQGHFRSRFLTVQVFRRIQQCGEEPRAPSRICGGAHLRVRDRRMKGIASERQQQEARRGLDSIH